MDILYHIGLPKAMSTWLQKELFIERMGYYSVPGALLMDVIQYKNIHSRKYSRETLLLALHAAKERNLTAVCSREGSSIALSQAKTNFRQRAQMIHQLGLDAKVLLILREQRSWLYSIYQEHVRLAIMIASLPRFLLSKDGIGDISHEMDTVGYDELIQTYYHLFGRDRVLVLPYELFLVDPRSWITQILHFSEITDTLEDKINQLAIHKKVYRSSSPFVVQATAGVGYLFFLPELNHAVQPNRGRIYPIFNENNVKRGKLKKRLTWLDTHVIPASYNMWLKQRWQSEIDYWVGNKYKASNARTSQLIGIDLAQYGYDV